MEQAKRGAESEVDGGPGENCSGAMENVETTYYDCSVVVIIITNVFDY